MFSVVDFWFPSHKKIIVLYPDHDASIFPVIRVLGLGLGKVLGLGLDNCRSFRLRPFQKSYVDPSRATDHAPLV